jgi:hypothetical protein
MAAIGRSILDMPLKPGQSILGHWLQEVADLAEGIPLRRLPLRVMLCRAAPIPTAPRGWGHGRVPLQIERDNQDFRGTGGVLRDLSEQYHKDDYLLVASGAQVLVEDLTGLAHALGRVAGDVVLLAHGEGTLCGLMLVRCGALAEIASVGFVDFKEQALPQLATRHHVSVLRRSHMALLSITTASDYLAALRRYGHRHGGRGTAYGLGPFGHAPDHGIVEMQARVEPSAIVHDAVILAGARVAARAIVARSIVCEGACVGDGQVVVNRVVTSRYGPHTWLERPAPGGRAPALAYA